MVRYPEKFVRLVKKAYPGFEAQRAILKSALYGWWLRIVYPWL